MAKLMGEVPDGMNKDLLKLEIKRLIYQTKHNASYAGRSNFSHNFPPFGNFGNHSSYRVAGNLPSYGNSNNWYNGSLASTLSHTSRHLLVIVYREQMSMDHLCIVQLMNKCPWITCVSRTNVHGSPVYREQMSMDHLCISRTSYRTIKNKCIYIYKNFVLCFSTIITLYFECFLFIYPIKLLTYICYKEIHIFISRN